MLTQPKHLAIVIGGSLAGLLAARVLAEQFARVLIVDRDHPTLARKYSAPARQSVA